MEQEAPTPESILVRNVYFKYGTQEALRDVNLTLQKGELLGLLGPNGGGKTTLFHLITTLFPVQRGDVLIQGESVKRQAKEIRKELGIIFQSPSLDLDLTVKENLLFHGRMYGVRGPELLERIETLAKEFRFEKRLDDRVKVLSGGYRRRIEIAKALLPEPSILLMDEPSNGLDPVARKELWNLFESIRRSRNLSILFTTHLMDEADLCDEVVILHHGRVVKSGRPEQLKKEVSGDVLILETQSPDELKKTIKEKYNIESQIVSEGLRMETENASALMLQILEGHQEYVDSIHLRKPTLEDVFFAATGMLLDKGGRA